MPEGVGNGEIRNRFCLIGFGSFDPLRTAHFRSVDGMVCYPASEFPRAQAQLLTQGLMEDGYEAIQFALDNVPFRNSPFIARNILLITDEGRTIIPEGINITQQSIEQQLKVLLDYYNCIAVFSQPFSIQSSDTLLNVIVAADYSLEDDTDAMVMGVDGNRTSYILEEGGSFSTSNNDFEVINVSQGNHGIGALLVSLCYSRKVIHVKHMWILHSLLVEHPGHFEYCAIHHLKKTRTFKILLLLL